MSTWTLPPLPDPPISKAGDWTYDGHVVSFDDAQNHARAYAMEAVLAERERCAAIADSYTKHHASATAHYFEKWIDAEKYHAARMDAGAQIRDAIREEPT